MPWTFNDQLASDLGISDIRRNDVGLAQGTCTFVLAGVNDDTPDADLPFATGNQVVIKLDGVRWFVGRFRNWQRSASGEEGDQLTGTLDDPWWYLANLIYEQEWANGADGSGRQLRSNVLLNRTANGTFLTTAQQIAAVVAYVNAVAVGAGGSAVMAVATTGFTAITPAADQQRDLPCSEVIRRQARFTPDLASWWDYSTTPPTLRFSDRANAEVKTVSHTSLAYALTARSITFHDDKVPTGVTIKYEIANSADDTTWVDTVVDRVTAPGTPERNFGMPVMTLDLQGSSTITEIQKVVAETILPNDPAWWRKKLPGLPTSGLTIEDGANSDPTFPREVVEGVYPRWREADFAEVTVTALATYNVQDSGGRAVAEYSKKPLSVTFRATKLSSKTYRQTSQLVDAEPVPEGLAQAFYDSVKVAHAEGRVTLIADEVPSGWHVGQVLNINDGETRWATMKAQIQQLDYAADTGALTITFGPATQLGPQDLLDQIRLNRGRVSGDILTITTGRSSRPEVPGGTGAPAANASESQAAPKRLKIADPATETAIYIDLDANPFGGFRYHYDGKTLAIESADLTRDVRLREVPWCEPGSTVEKRVLVLMSEPYDAS